MNIDKITKGLEEIGLAGSEIKVYLALLDLGSSTTGPIVDKSDTANSRIYIVLDKLIDKGLVTFFQQEGLKYYRVANPNQILRYLKDKQNTIKEQEKDIKDILPDLLGAFSRKEEDKGAVVYRGSKGVRAAFADFSDSLKKGEEARFMGAYNFGEAFRRVVAYGHSLRSEKGIKAKFLINRNAKEMADDVLSRYPPIEVRLMDEGVSTPAIFIIYANKVLISLGDEMTVFMIKSESAAKAFNVYFEQNWENAEKYIKKN